jgi:hypothetical protein
MDTSQWFNAYAPIEDEIHKDVEIQRGDLLVHFAGRSNRETLMNEWCEQSEKQDPEWVVYPEDTDYPAEVGRFWESFRVARAARRDFERIWEAGKLHLQLMVRFASRALMKMVEEIGTIQQSRSASEKLLQRIKALGGMDVTQEDMQELNSTIGNIEQVRKQGPLDLVKEITKAYYSARYLETPHYHPK